MDLIAPSRWRAVDFISDLHLHPDEPLTLQAWFRYLERTTADAVFILGDLFEVWVGDDCLDHDPFARQCAAALGACSKHADIFIMHGNRDFLMGDALMQVSQTKLLNDPTVLIFNGTRYLLSHGDTLCLDDTAYQAFRKTVRSPEWQQQFLSQPLVQRQLQARQMRAQSENTKRSAMVYADVDALAAAQLLNDAAAPTLIHGHTHRPAHHTLANGMDRWVLSDWHLDGSEPRCDVLRLSQQSGDAVVHRITLAMAEASQLG